MDSCNDYDSFVSKQCDDACNQLDLAYSKYISLLLKQKEQVLCQLQQTYLAQLESGKKNFVSIKQNNHNNIKECTKVTTSNANPMSDIAHITNITNNNQIDQCNNYQSLFPTNIKKENIYIKNIIDTQNDNTFKCNMSNY